MIDAIRKAYLRDVVTIKQQVILSKEDPNFDHENTTLKHRIPSLDMRPTLDLFAPAECSLKVKPCDGCGGSLEIIHRESKRVAALAKACADLQLVEQECRMKASRMELQASKDRRALEELEERSAADKEVFLRQIRRLKEQLAEVDVESFERIRRALSDMAKELASNNDKMGAFNMLKDQMDAMGKEQEEMHEKLEESLMLIRETERLRAEAERARKEIEEKEVRACETRSDKLGKRVDEISMLVANTFVPYVTACRLCRRF